MTRERERERELKFGKQHASIRVTRLLIRKGWTMSQQPTANQEKERKYPYKIDEHFALI